MKTFKELTPEERIAMRRDNPAEYSRLYKAEYGVEASIYDVPLPPGQKMSVPVVSATGMKGKTFAQLTAEERIAMRHDNPVEYHRLYKAEYGVEASVYDVPLPEGSKPPVYVTSTENARGQNVLTALSAMNADDRSFMRELMKRKFADRRTEQPFHLEAMKVKAENSSDLASVKIIGIIGLDNGAEDFRKFIDDLVAGGVTDCQVYINSEGGCCFDTAEIVNILSKFKGKVTGKGGAIVASAATYIAVHCHSFVMPTNDQFMIHKPSGSISGTASELRARIAMLENIESEYYEAYKAIAADPGKFERQWNAGDYWMTAQEAKDAGFITEVEKIR